METVFVRAGRHVVRALQAFVGKNFYVRRDIHHRAEGTRLRAEQRQNFFGSGRTHGHGTGLGGKLRLIQLVITTNQN